MVLASLLVSVLGLVSAIYTMQVYDRVVPTGAFSTLFVLTVGVLISVTLEAALGGNSRPPDPAILGPD